MTGARNSIPRLSVVLATDTYDTIRPVISALQRQRNARDIEPVIVLPDQASRDIPADALNAFAPARIVVVDNVDQLAPARAAGVRAASAPVVFIGETHTYARPGWADALLAQFDGPWSAVVPAVGNANPTGPASWAAYLFDYATWGPTRSSGEISDPLIYNTAYRRATLLALDGNLAESLDPKEESMWPRLWAAGHRATFAPEAQIVHLNVNRLGWLLEEKFSSGVALGMRRAVRWPLWRRMLYVLGSPLIPAVLLVRIARKARLPAQSALPAATIPVLALSAVAKTIGEVVGYLGFNLPASDAQLTEMEIHKVRYAGRGT